MSSKTTIVINGYFNLSREEKNEVIIKINEYEKGTDLEKSILTEDFDKIAERVVSGPLDGSCPCCGR